MFKRFFGSKFTVLFLSMALIGFLIGYEYALVTSRQDKAETINSRSSGEKINTTENLDTTVQVEEMDDEGLDEELTEQYTEEYSEELTEEDD